MFGAGKSYKSSLGDTGYFLPHSEPEHIYRQICMLKKILSKMSE
jgi:hypothetical protein